MDKNSNAMSAGPNVLSVDAQGNPSYTIKEGGTLKKKMQPYAADKTGRDGLNIDRERLQQVTAPGTYDLPSDFSTKDPYQVFKKKSANEKLRKMGILNETMISNIPADPSESGLEFKNRNSSNISKTQKNYYTHQGDQDYMLSTQDQFAQGAKASNLDNN